MVSFLKRFHHRFATSLPPSRSEPNKNVFEAHRPFRVILDGDEMMKKRRRKCFKNERTTV